MLSCHTYVNTNFTDIYVYISIQLSTTTEKFGSYSGRNLEWVQLQPPWTTCNVCFNSRFCSKHLVELWKFPMFWVSSQILVWTTDLRMLVSKIIPFVNKIISLLMYSFNTCAVLSSICILKNSRSRVPFYIESFKRLATVSQIEATWMSRWKLGSMVRINGFFSPTYKWGILGLSPTDPNLWS